MTNRGPGDGDLFPRIHVTDKRGENKNPPVEPSAPEAPVAEDPSQLAEERLDQLLRLKADFENYRKRVIREQTDLVDRASLRIVERLLPVLDDLDRALRAAEEHQRLDAIVRGIELVQKQLHETLVDEGLERVMAEGPFDPHEHEAVSSMPGDVPEPTVLEVVRPGYKLKGKTIRPALVHVRVPHALPSSEEGSE
ncbi:MAG: nucleotide exchange factor GrpE [Actinomycetota bacterium]